MAPHLKRIGQLATATGALAASLTGTGALAPFPPAGASHEDEGLNDQEADNPQHNVITADDYPPFVEFDLEQHGDTSDVLAGIQWGQNALDVQTDMTTTYPSQTWSDVVWEYSGSFSLPNTWCEEEESAQYCDKFIIDIDGGSQSTNGWKSVGCHETGHTTAIGHRTDTNTDTCMPSNAQIDSAEDLAYDEHDVDAIEAEHDDS